MALPGLIQAGSITQPNQTMKQKNHVRFKLPALIILAAFGLAGAARAQTSPTQVPTPQSAMASNPSGGMNYGLIGQDYYGFDFTYIHHVDGPPRVLHRYGFVANKPFAPGFDVGLKYNWLTGSASGRSTRQQEVSVPLTAYLYNGWGRPFIEGDAGWVWQKAGGASKDSFAFLVGAGFEFQVCSTLVVTPYVNYHEASRLHDYVTNYGAKATYRFTREWSGSLGAQIDEERNLGYTAGLNWYF